MLQQRHAKPQLGTSTTTARVVRWKMGNCSITPGNVTAVLVLVAVPNPGHCRLVNLKTAVCGAR